MMAPQLRRNARIERRGGTTAPSGVRGKLLMESRHQYAHYSAKLKAQEAVKLIISDLIRAGRRSARVLGDQSVIKLAENVHIHRSCGR